MATGKDPAWKIAEKRVGEKLLDLLVDGYLILNDIKYRYGNMDHVVIRPDGTIFLCETKSHKGIVTTDGKRILINGRPLKTNPISQVMRSIRWIRDLAKRLSGKNPWVVAVLVFPNAKISIRHPVQRINVIEMNRLVDFIRSC
ncbi:MAG: nuclease-related domain-containing protein [Kiritimatiellae bacterium]|nr:nuclease-related domain-containing protein [Kiritimatiellia bacterium]MDD5519508.1 nuclease-related domain-containing protein [Kiritimatiellia bacterium]